MLDQPPFFNAPHVIIEEFGFVSPNGGALSLLAASSLCCLLLARTRAATVFINELDAPSFKGLRIVAIASFETERRARFGGWVIDSHERQENFSRGAGSPSTGVPRQGSL